MKINKKTLFMITIVIASLLLAACGGAGEAPIEESTPDIFTDFVPVVSATGKVVPSDWATLSVANSGIVVDLAVEENDEVSAGQTLLQLDGIDRLNAAVATAHLELVSAQIALNDIIDNADVATNEAAQTLANARDAVRDAERALTNLSIPA
jgi:multidrug efflux pump subunit AcrA (membrane-fusion protein)